MLGVVNDLSNKLCVSSETEDLNPRVFNMIAGINKSKTLKKHISCESKCIFDGRKCNSNQKWNIDNIGSSVKNTVYVKKIIIGIMLHVVVKMENI